MSDFQGFRADIEHWANVWDAAQKKGVFNDEKTHTPSVQTSEPSFFGLVSSRPGQMTAADGETWSHIANRSAESPSSVLHEDIVPVPGNTKVKTTANPVPTSSFGKDQSDAHSMGYTFTNEQLEELADMKLKLEELGTKIAEAASKGLNFQQLQNKIDEMQQKIDDLSDELSLPPKGTPGR